MLKSQSIKLVVGVTIALIGFVPVANAGSMGNGAQQRIAAAVNRCLAMPHDKMVANQYCKSLMTQHPEMFAGK